MDWLCFYITETVFPGEVASCSIWWGRDRQQKFLFCWHAHQAQKMYTQNWEKLEPWFIEITMSGINWNMQQVLTRCHPLKWVPKYVDLPMSSIWHTNLAQNMGSPHDLPSFFNAWPDKGGQKVELFYPSWANRQDKHPMSSNGVKAAFIPDLGDAGNQFWFFTLTFA